MSETYWSMAALLLIGSESGIEQAWNWTAQLNEAAMLLFALFPWILFKVLTSSLLPILIW